MIKNAVAYVFRKRTRTALIFLILTLILAVIYAGFSIMKTSEKMTNAINSANDFGVKIRSLKSETFNAESFDLIDSKLGAEKIFQYEGVAEIKNGEVVTGEQMVMREDLPGYLGNAVMLQAISDVKKDPLFRSEVFKLIEGKNIAREEAGKVLVHEALAKKNQWKVGDKVSLKVLGEEKELELFIQGIFTGKKQEKYTGLSSDFSENTIFSDFETTMRSLNLPEDKDLLSKITLYTETADQLDKAIAKTEKLNIDWSKYKIEKNNAAFKDTLESIAGVKNIINLMTYLIIIGGSVVLSLILMLWLRERIYEIGILLSIGASKLQIVSQFIIELVLISIPTIISSFILGNLVFSLITKGLSEAEETSSIASSFANSIFGLDSLAVFIQSYSILVTIIILSVIIASIMILVKKPKEILSKIS